MTLKKFQQSELKRFYEDFGHGSPKGEMWSDLRVEAITKQLLSSIEKAFALGKEEKDREKLNKQSKNWRRKMNLYFLNLLKNK